MVYFDEDVPKPAMYLDEERVFLLKIYIYFQECSEAEKTIEFQERADAKAETLSASVEESKKKRAQRISKKTGINVVHEKTSSLQVTGDQTESALTTQTTSSMNLAESSAPTSGFTPKTEEASKELVTESSEVVGAVLRKESSGATQRALTQGSTVGVNYNTHCRG